MGPEGTYSLRWPAIGQALGLSHRGEQLGVEELVSEPAVEGFSKAVLPRGAGLDVSGCGAAAFTPAPQGVGDEFGTVVAADECRSWVEAGEILQHRHHILGLAASSDADRQAQMAVLVDHVQELQPPAIGGGVELEIHRPHRVGMLNPLTQH